MRKHTAAGMGIRASSQKRDKWESRPPGELLFSRDTSLKIGTVPENPGRMVALLLRVYSVGPNNGEGFTILAFSLATTANVVTWSFQAGNCPKFIHHGPLTR